MNVPHWNEVLERLRRAPWNRTFDPRTLQRGAQYSAQGRVQAVTLSPAGRGLTLSAVIEGSRRYRCEVVFDDAAQLAKFESRCDCPVGWYCKHAAALLFQAEAQPAAAAKPEAPLQEWERWMSSLETPPPPAADEWRRRVLEPGRQLALILRVPPPGRAVEIPRLQAQAVWLRPLKNKRGFGEPLAVGLTASGLDPVPSGGYEDVVNDALVTLLAGAGHLYGGATWRELRHAHQERALESLMRHCVCYWERSGTVPLSFGAQRRLLLDWRDLEGGQKLVAAVEGRPEARPFRIGTLWYFDPQRRELGRLEGDERLLATIEAAPMLPPEHSAVLKQRLSMHPRLGAFSASAVRAPVQALHVAPQPQLRLMLLRYSRGRGGAGFCAARARLSFGYGRWRLPAQGTLVERRFDGNDVVEIHRDLDAEQAARERLRAEHLVDYDLTAVAVLFDRQDEARGDYVIERTRTELASPEHWLDLLPRLASAGFQLEFDEDFPLRLTEASSEWTLDLAASDHHWFDLSLGIEVDGERQELLPILRRLLLDPKFPLKRLEQEPEDARWLVAVDEQRYVLLPLARLRGVLEPLLEWLGEGSGSADTLRLGRLQAGVLEELGGTDGLLLRGAEGLRTQLETLRAQHGEAPAPAGFTAVLRPYQRAGLGWLNFLGEAGLGGVLADDMGLGKTVQVLAHLCAQRLAGRLGGEAGPALIVCPTSLVGNWRAEAARFAPDLRVLVLHGPERAAQFSAIGAHDVVITTYPLLGRDREALAAQRYALLVLDEAQQVKNARTQAAQVVRELPATRRLAMTGTPLENHLGELWAQFDAVEPGLLGRERGFVRHYRTPIEQHADPVRRDRLLRRIAPLMLRRRKDEVLADLPPKNEILRSVELEGRQRELYESLRLAQHLRVQEAVAQRGLKQSGIVVLDALLKLRQVCCDPRLVKLSGARRLHQSAKLELLLELLPSLVAEGRRVLVFSQFTEMLALIAQALEREGIAHLMLTGQTRKRAELVARFQAGEVPVFLISLKAGGVGLNLTAADTVIHYDPWWNPAVEAQATDRAHRIGQQRAVFVYRLICAGTVEEKIQSLQARKAELARAVLEGGSTQALRFDAEDLDALFAPI